MWADSSNLAAVGAVAGIVATVSGVLVALWAQWRASKKDSDGTKQSIVEFSQAALKDLIAETKAMNETLRRDLTTANSQIDDLQRDLAAAKKDAAEARKDSAALRREVKDNERECEKRLSNLQSQLEQLLRGKHE